MVFDENLGREVQQSNIIIQMEGAECKRIVFFATFEPGESEGIAITIHVRAPLRWIFASISSIVGVVRPSGFSFAVFQTTELRGFGCSLAPASVMASFSRPARARNVGRCEVGVFAGINVAGAGGKINVSAVRFGLLYAGDGPVREFS